MKTFFYALVTSLETETEKAQILRKQKEQEHGAERAHAKIQ